MVLAGVKGGMDNGNAKSLGVQRYLGKKAPPPLSIGTIEPRRVFSSQTICSRPVAPAGIWAII